LFPWGCVSKKIDITHDTVYYFSYKTIKPDLVDLELRKNFQTYLKPGDTLKIVANLDPNIDDIDAIEIDGELGEICNFYSKKHEKLGYWDISNSLTGFTNISYPIEKAILLSDSIYKSEMDFLINYNRMNKLPPWFYQIMKTDIEYGKVGMRSSLIAYRKFFFKENIVNPDKYYTFDKIKLYNPKAKLSYYYYQCIDLYLMGKYEYDLEKKHGLERSLPIFERSIPEAKEMLKGEILEFYLAYRTSASFAICKNINELTRVDSLYKSLKTQFQNEEIIKIINNQRDYRAEYFESLKNNPFTFTKIIPGDNK
jgi:hypothetical protein